MDRDADRTQEGAAEGSPLGSYSERVTTPDLLSEGPVRFLLVSGDQDDGGWGLVRASNTQPVLVLRFEGRDETAVRRIRDVMEEAVERARAAARA